MIRKFQIRRHHRNENIFDGEFYHETPAPSKWCLQRSWFAISDIWKSLFQLLNDVAFWLFKTSEFEQWKFKKIYSNQRKISKTDSASCERWHNCSNKKRIFKVPSAAPFGDSTMCFQQFDWFRWVGNFGKWKRDRSIDDVINRFMIFFMFQFKLKKDPARTSDPISCGRDHTEMLSVKCNLRS